MGLLRKVMGRKTTHSFHDKKNQDSPCFLVTEDLESNISTLHSYLNGSIELEIERINLGNKVLGLRFSWQPQKRK